MTTPISSTQNPWVKRIQKLMQKSRVRRQENAFVVEGNRELERALSNGYEVEAIFLTEKASLAENLLPFEEKLPPPIHFSTALFEKISLRSGSEDTLAILKGKTHDLEKFKLHDGLYLVAVGIEKPGNLGALLRTAAGGGIQGVVVVDALTDLYNPHCIRNSMGGVFSLPIACTNSATAVSFFKKHQCPIYSAALHPKAENYQTIAYPKICALAVGNEAEGLPAAWTSNTSTLIQIPMRPPIDSLNVSVAAGIVSYHIVMQQKQS